jgi:hypothetical protein
MGFHGVIDHGGTAPRASATKPAAVTGWATNAVWGTNAIVGVGDVVMIDVPEWWGGS